MVAGIFVSSGINQLRHPEYVAEPARKVGVPIAERIPYLPTDPVQLARINAAVHAGAGTLLALGRFPRLSALALAASLLPTTAAGHPFWEEEEPGQKVQQQIHFLKNVSILGGLLLAAVDTQGKPGLAWRTQHALAGTRHVARATRREAKLATRAARYRAAAATGKARGRLTA